MCYSTTHFDPIYNFITGILRVMFYRNHRNNKKKVGIKIARPIHNTTMGTPYTSNTF
jgi:hypothetical protein